MNTCGSPAVLSAFWVMQSAVNQCFDTFKCCLWLCWVKVWAQVWETPCSDYWCAGSVVWWLAPLSRHLVLVLEHLTVGGPGGVHCITASLTQAVGHPVLPGLPDSTGHLHDGPRPCSVVVGYYQCKYRKERKINSLVEGYVNRFVLLLYSCGFFSFSSSTSSSFL